MRELASCCWTFAASTAILLACWIILWVEAIGGNQIDPLVDLVQKGLLFWHHITLHLAAKVLRGALGDLLDVTLPGVRCLRELAIRGRDVRPKDLVIQL